VKMRAEAQIAAPRSRVWDALNDADVLRQCIPGCQSLQKEGADKLRATVEVKIGPIGARFNSIVTFSDVQPPQGYTLTGEGQGGTVGSAKATIRVRLDENAAGTLLSYEVDAQVGGRLAQLGGPIIDATAKQFATRFFKQFAEFLGASNAPSAGILQEASSKPPEIPAVAAHSSQQPSGSFPIAWILALTVAALAGFLMGQGHSDASQSSWMGLAIGLLVIVVAAASFEFGRRTSAPQIVLDAALLQRLLRGGNQ
jgi:carbon monoxide dehydrogenase subunit G